MAQTARIPDTVHAEAERLAKERDMSVKEAIRYMCREGGFDV